MTYSIHMTSWKRQILQGQKTDQWFLGDRRVGGGEDGMWLRAISGDETVVYLDCSDGYLEELSKLIELSKWGKFY